MTAILAFDTSTQSTSVALAIDGEIYTDFKDSPRQHSDFILPMIDDVLRQANIQGKDIDAIAITNGPGSFMGTRLSVGVAQGLGYAWGCQICMVSTLQCLAQTAYMTKGLDQVVAVWDARMGEVYWGTYMLQERLMQVVQTDHLSPPNEVPRMAGCQLVGNMDLPTYDGRVDMKLEASALLPFARYAIAHNQLVSPLEIEPIYLRASVVNR